MCIILLVSCFFFTLCVFVLGANPFVSVWITGLLVNGFDLNDGITEKLGKYSDMCTRNNISWYSEVPGDKTKEKTAQVFNKEIWQ